MLRHTRGKVRLSQRDALIPRIRNQCGNMPMRNVSVGPAFGTGFAPVMDTGTVDACSFGDCTWSAE